MEKDYYFSFDEPILYDKKIICTFHISNIERKRGYFFLVNEENQFNLYYTIVSDSDLVKIVKEYANKFNLDKKIKFFDIFVMDDFKKVYNVKFLRHKTLNNQQYVGSVLEKMSKDNIYMANNNIQGLDGFSVELKLNKGENCFYAWCSADDKKYFYVLDFVNLILDELKINKEYRFEKVE